jgi:hypothetical protein
MKHSIFAFKNTQVHNKDTYSRIRCKLLDAIQQQSGIIVHLMVTQYKVRNM